MLAFDLPLFTSLAIGMVLALSSTAIVNQTLSEKGLMKSDGGKASFSVLLFQDIAVIPMLIILPLLALPELYDMANAAHHDTHASDNEHGLDINMVKDLTPWQTSAVALLVISIVIAVGHYLTDHIFHFVSKAKLRELFVSTALMIVLAIAILMTMVGLSPALGTFLAGVVMASSDYRHEIESDIAPFKGIFLGIFFITVGAGIDFGLLKESLLLTLELTLVLILLKFAIIFVLAGLFNVEGSSHWLFALGLAQAGEFGFVLLSFTTANHIIPSDVSSMLLLVVALSMLLTPVLFIIYDRIVEPYFNKREEEKTADEIEEQGSVIIAGHGRFGGIINRSLSGAGITTTVVDYSSEQLAMLRKFGLNRVYYGDATRPDLLEAAGIAHAKTLVIAIDEKEAITELTRYVSHHYPSVHLVARAVNRMHVYELWAAGCRDIIRETYDSSLRASRSALEGIGYSRESAQRMVSAFEELDRTLMVEMADLYNPDVPIEENHEYIQKIKDMHEDWEQELKGRMSDAQTVSQ